MAATAAQIEHDQHAKEQKYWIGNIEQRVDGWCFREHMFGILVDVQSEWEGRHYIPPIPQKRVRAAATALVKDYRWSQSAYNLCAPSWGPR